MSPQELKTTGEALIALSEGKAVQYWSPIHSKWFDAEPTGFGIHPLGAFPYQIKLIPAKRLLRPEELPPHFWIREITCPELWRSVGMIGSVNLWYAYAGGFSMLDLQDAEALAKWQWSAHRKTAHSFWTEEA